MTGQPIVISEFLAYTVGILVYFAGMWVNRRVAILRSYHIPDPVTGGHGSTIVWAPEIAASHGVPNALEIGIAMATFGRAGRCSRAHTVICLGGGSPPGQNYCRAAMVAAAPAIAAAPARLAMRMERGLVSSARVRAASVM